MKFRSQLFRGDVMHRRLTPLAHTFTYPTTFFGFDLGELDALDAAFPWFGRNRPRPLSLRDTDYLRGRHAPVLEQLGEFLPPEAPGERTVLITSPRYFGYAFNPVNFYLRLRDGALRAAAAEVNNTFGDRHIYPLSELREDPETGARRQSVAKDFHVSPFNEMGGTYHFDLRVAPERIFLGIDLHVPGEGARMRTWLRGRALPLNRANLLRYALLRPLDTALNSMPRILWQAALLHYRKRLPVHKRPSPQSAHTLVDRDDREGHDPMV